MATKTNGKPNGRPPKEFDPKIFENLCHVHCTIQELEAILESDQRVIDYWCKRHYSESFSTCYKRFAEGGKASLRRNQMNLSRTNAAMCIWLGKQLLGQRDIPQELEHFNGKLSMLLDTLKSIKSEQDFKERKTNNESSLIEQAVREDLKECSQHAPQLTPGVTPCVGG